MHRHKSLGLLTGMIVAPRVAYRLSNMAGVCTTSARKKEVDNFEKYQWFANQV